MEVVGEVLDAPLLVGESFSSIQIGQKNFDDLELIIDRKYVSIQARQNPCEQLQE